MTLGYGGGTQTLGRAESRVMPAAIGGVRIVPGETGRASLVACYVPDLDLDVVGPLRDAGYSDEEIRTLAKWTSRHTDREDVVGKIVTLGEVVSDIYRGEELSDVELEQYVNGCRGGRWRYCSFALRFVAHLVGDIHQPLHAGFAEDRGGNSVDVRFNGRKENLHSLWDTALVELEQGTPAEIAARIQADVTAEDRRQWQQGTPADWR